MEPSPSFSLVLVKERQKIEVFFCQQKGKIVSFVKSFVEKEKNKGKEKLEKKKKKLNFYSKLLSFKILFLFFLK